jgi:hypothetical protein
MMTTPLRPNLDLKGTWKLAFDTDGTGIDRGWTRGNFPAHAEDEQVPAIWEISHPDVQGIGFYRRTFSVPADWTNHALSLEFGGASYRADVWLNGTYLGGHEGSYTPFAFDVTDRVRRDEENELVVRVAGLARHGRLVDGRLIDHVPHSKQDWYYLYSGLWGSVRLEARNPVAIASVWAEPYLRRELVRLEIAIENGAASPQSIQLAVEILDPDGAVQFEQGFMVQSPPGIASPEVRIPLPHPCAWSCETPNLYTARVSIRQNDAVIDESETRFGMRDFTIRNGEFILNGEPILIRGVLLQPNYPVSLIVPPTAEMLRKDVELAKQAGFNLMRAHLRPSPAGFLDIADELGMLVYAESSIAWIRENPRLLEHCQRELQAVIERDRNHPSVVIWGIHNENRVANAKSGEALVRLVRSLDPTRVVLDHSGGSLTIDQDFGWIDRTTVVADRATTRETMHDIHAYVGSPIPDGVYEWLRTLGQTPSKIDMSAYNFGARALFEEWYRELRGYEGKLFVSELGCGGLADLEQVVAGFGEQTQLVDAREMITFRDGMRDGFQERHLDRVFGSVEGLVRRAQARHSEGTLRQVEALLCNPRVSGYSITQWNDVAWEFHAGLVDHWRNPKQVFYDIQRLHRPHCLVTKAARSVAQVGSSVDVMLTLVNQVPLVTPASIEIVVQNPEGVVISTETRSAPAGRGVQECGSVRIALGQRGEFSLVARLAQGGEALAETTERILALPAIPLAEIAQLVEWVGQPPPLFSEIPAAPNADKVLYAAQPATVSQSDWDLLFRQVKGGRTAIIEALQPGYALALRALAEQGISVDLHYGIGNWMPCYHWIPKSPLFEGLPAGDLAGEVYVDVLPWYVPIELGGEILAGSFRNTQTRLEPTRLLWYSDVEALKLGQGKLYICQYRLTEHADNPLAARLLCNLLNVARGE